MAAIARDWAGAGARGARLLVGGALAGAIAGFIVGGGGARLAMRIAAAVDEEDRGAFTEAGEVVGEITAGGTLFILVAGGMLGLVFGLFYAVTRTWLPFSGAARAAVFGVVSLSFIGPLLVDDHNVDFIVLDPAALSVAMFAAIPFLFGVATALVADRLSPRDPRWLRAGPIRLLGAIVLGAVVLRGAVDVVHSAYLILA